MFFFFGRLVLHGGTQSHPWSSLESLKDLRGENSQMMFFLWRAGAPWCHAVEDHPWSSLESLKDFRRENSQMSVGPHGCLLKEKWILSWKETYHTSAKKWPIRDGSLFCKQSDPPLKGLGHLRRGSLQGGSLVGHLSASMKWVTCPARGAHQPAKAGWWGTLWKLHLTGLGKINTPK